MMNTPHYLIDKSKLLLNLERIEHLREKSGAKALLALKRFPAWSVFDFIRPYMDSATSSSLNKVRLGSTRFGGETHAYGVAWADHEIYEAAGLAWFMNRMRVLEFFRSVCGLRNRLLAAGLAAKSLRAD